MDIVYIIVGLVVEFVEVMLTRAMLGLTSARTFYTGGTFIQALLHFIGPSLLILAGSRGILKNVSRNKSCLVTGSIVVVGFAAWTIPTLGLRLAGWLIVAPLMIALFIGVAVVLTWKARIAAMVGSLISAPFFLYNSGAFLYYHWSSASPFSLSEILVLAPATLLVSTFVLALCSRGL
jgi:hypothetical protein